MTISLDKLNTWYKQVADFLPVINSLHEKFLEETGENYRSPFRYVSDFDSIVRMTKTDLALYIVRAYQNKFCPNLDVEKEIGGISIVEEWFPSSLEFNAVQLVSKINEIVLKDPEKVAYDSMLKSARGILPYGIRDPSSPGSAKDIKQKLKRKNVFQGQVYARQDKVHAHDRLLGRLGGRNFKPKIRIEFSSQSDLVAFEKFAELIIRNDGLYQRVAPSQLDAHPKISEQVFLDATVPQTIYGHPYIIEKAIFFKNGRVDFIFNSEKDCDRVVNALAGDPPDVYFPQPEIDVSLLFQRDPAGRGKRVVKRLADECVE